MERGRWARSRTTHPAHLGVDHERPPPAARRENAVVHADAVARQPCEAPLSDLRGGAGRCEGAAQGGGAVAGCVICCPHSSVPGGCNLPMRICAAMPLGAQHQATQNAQPLAAWQHPLHLNRRGQRAAQRCAGRDGNAARLATGDPGARQLVPAKMVWIGCGRRVPMPASCSRVQPAIVPPNVWPCPPRRATMAANAQRCRPRGSQQPPT